MLMEVKRNLKLMLHYFKFNLSAVMEYRISFITQIIGMMLNNTAFIFFWYILFNNIDKIGGYGFSDVMLLWALSSSAFGLSNIIFGNVRSITRMILNGELDSYLLQPKDPLINILCSKTVIHGWGDFIYGFILLIAIKGFNMEILLFLLLTVTGAMIFTSLQVTLHSLSFHTGNCEGIAELAAEFLISFSIYPEGIFNGGLKFVLYSIIPSAFIAYVPAAVLNEFSITKIFLILGVATLWSIIAYWSFYKGLKKYESGNLILSKI